MVRTLADHFISSNDQMRKIANTTELTGELIRLLNYAGSHQPSRVKLASKLRELSQRVAAVDPVKVLRDAWYKAQAEWQDAKKQGKPAAQVQALKQISGQKHDEFRDAEHAEQVAHRKKLGPTPQVGWDELRPGKKPSVPTPEKIRPGDSDENLIRTLKEVAKWIEARIDLDFRTRRDTADMMRGLIRDVQAKKKDYETYVPEIVNDTIETFE